MADSEIFLTKQRQKINVSPAILALEYIKLLFHKISTLQSTAFVQKISPHKIPEKFTCRFKSGGLRKNRNGQTFSQFISVNRTTSRGVTDVRLERCDDVIRCHFDVFDILWMSMIMLSSDSL